MKVYHCFKGMIHRHVLLFCFILLTIPGHGHSSDLPDVEWGENRNYGYAIKLFNRGDYFRSISEVLRIESENQSESPGPNHEYLLFLNYLKLGYDSDVDVFASSILSQPAEQKVIFEKKTVFACWVHYLIEKDKLAEVADIFDEYGQLVGVGKKTNPHPKNQGFIDPKKAKQYSMIIPGAGFVMTEEYSKALISFGLNVSFVSAAYQSLMMGNTATALLFTFFEIGWYLGGQKAAVEAAEQTNAKREKAYWIDVTKALDLTCSH